jgi:16S rRNA (cytidine1402-2'-O)-methyltransferase
MTGTLFLVPNTLDFGVVAEAPAPLSDDLPLGVIRIAARLEHWIAENAKTTRAFLKRVDAVAPLAQTLQSIQIVELPRPQKGAKHAGPAQDLDALLAPALRGVDMGLISEAGLPAVADPGAVVVEAAHRLGVKVVPLSGPSSLMLALAASGLNGQSFAFVGYLPVETAERGARIRELEGLSRRLGQTQLVIETPYRNEAVLEGLLNTLAPGTRLSVSCGLTLPSGWTRTDTVARWRSGKTAIAKDVPAVFCLLA